MPNFDPRAIPGRAHYDRLETWAVSVLGRLDGDTLAELQAELTERAKIATQGDDDDAKVFAVLAEIGFCHIIDNMASRIEAGE